MRRKEISLIFLDIDGPIISVNHRKWLKDNGYSTRQDLMEFDKQILSNLKYIICETNAKIVLSSTWRFGLDVNNADQSSEDCKNLIRQFALNGIMIYDKTPVRDDRVRGLEILEYIKEYLDQHDMADNELHYIVIDDDDFDIDPFIAPARIIKIDGDKGLTEADANLAIYSLNKQTHRK